MTGKNKGVFVFAFLMLLACSPKRNTFVSRQYNDINAYFNALFNGRESFQAGAKKLEAKEPEGFDDILPVFAFQYPGSPGSVASEMQQAIDKSEKMIRERSITAKPKKKKNLTKEERAFYNRKEFNRWVPDAHLLIGQSNVYLQDYGLAEEKFNFIVSEYPKEDPAVFQSLLWQAIVSVQKGDYGIAENGLAYLKKNKKFPQEYRSLLDAAFADLYIKQKKYTEAISALSSALTKTRGKSTKIRYNYILAQLYQQVHNNGKALEHYKKVLKYNPPYFTAFSAEMALAFSYNPKEHSDAVRKTLEKALKDERNSEYLDQVYFALAKLEESAGNTEKALDYYRQSIAANGINNRQKGLAYLALAEHYIKVPDYIKAFDSYDNASRMLGPDHSRYKEVAAEAQKLYKLATNLSVIQKEDSLQRLAGMSAGERNQILEKKVRQNTEQARQAEAQRVAEEQMRIQADKNRTMNNRVQVSSAGQWYFYNPTAMTLGASDFAARWGKRKLEDNWRRRNKSATQYNPFDNDANLLAAADAEEKKNESGKKDINAYLSEIPLGNEAKEASNSKIVQAMFYVGEAYRDDIGNVSKAIKALEDLLDRFPQSELTPATLVALFNLYSSDGDSGKAIQYRNTMLAQYPNHPQVLAATDPSYIGRMQQKAAAEEAAYNTAVSMYASGNRAGANQAAQKALRENPDSKLAPQFLLIKTMSDEYSGNADNYKAALNNIVSKYPTSDAATTAKNLMQGIGEVKESEKTEVTAVSTPGSSQANALPSDKPASTQPDANPDAVQNTIVNYTKEDGVHFFAIVVDAPQSEIVKLQFNLTSFTADNFLGSNYEVQGMDFGTSTLFLVGEMKNKKAAMTYYKKAMDAKGELMLNIPDDKYTIFVISDANMFLLQESKSASGYYKFFNENYLK